MTLQVKHVLRGMLGEPGREYYGLERCELTELTPGTMCPLLARLEEAGWLESRWEHATEQAVSGRPRPGGITGSAGTELRQHAWRWHSPTARRQGRSWVQASGLPGPMGIVMSPSPVRVPVPREKVLGW